MSDRRKFWVILTIVFLGFIGISMPYLIFPALFLNPLYSILPSYWSDSTRAILLGITLAAYPLGQFFGSPILGSLSDDYGRKKLLSGSLIISALCNLLTGLAIYMEYVHLLILSRFFAGLMEGNIAIARAMAAGLKTIPKNESLGKVNATISIAFLLGPLVGGLLTDKTLYEGFSTTTPFYCIGFLFLCIGALSMWLLENDEMVAPLQARPFWERINLFKRLGRLFSNKRLKFLLITFACFTLAVDIFYEFGPVYLTVKWNYGPAELVYYNAVLCFTLAIGNGWLPTFLSSYSSHRIIYYSMGAFAALLLGMTMTSSTLIMMILFALSGFIIGINLTMITVKISNTASESIQGEVLGVQLSLRVLGDALICLCGGLLLLLSPKLILIAASGISVATLLYFALGGRTELEETNL